MREVFFGALLFSLMIAISTGCDSGSTSADTGVSDAGGDGGVTDGSVDGDAQVTDGGKTAYMRHFTYRALAGVSMGACGAGFVGGRHPDLFDSIAPLGGYINMVYLMHMVRDRKFAGFCSVEKVLANIANVNNPGDILNPDPAVWCGPVKGDLAYSFEGKDYFYEHTEDYNHWFFADPNAKFDRDSHREMFQDLSMGLGNPLSYNPEGSYLAPGLTKAEYLKWLKDPERCKRDHMPVIDTPPYNCNAEYNPDCKYPIVFYCDGDRGVSEQNPDYWRIKGTWDPYNPNAGAQPFAMVGSIDYNSNGFRDYGEPVVFNGFERFKDVGSDGCADPYEDGKGGCCLDADLAAGNCLRPYDKGTNPDPNGDNFRWDKATVGTEGNWLYDEGEPFDDFGLDGVKADAGKGIPPDYGEGNGKFDYSPNFQRYMDNDFALNIYKLHKKDPAALKRLDIYIDGGIRDIFNSGAMSLASLPYLREAGLNVKVFDNFTGYKTSLFDGDFTELFTGADYSRSAIGQATMVLYGNPDATQREIMDGDGAHIGAGEQISQRFLTYLAWVTKRWSTKREKTESDTGRLIEGWFYSESLKSTRRYTVAVPPGYDTASNANRRYPVVYFLHGYGMDAGSMSALSAIFATYMQMGDIPKAIFVYPEGGCCYANQDTGARECGCKEDASNTRYLYCMGKDGTDRHVPKSDLPTLECNSGSFYLDEVSDKFANDSTEYMKYDGSVVELMGIIDKNYRTKAPEDVMVYE